jgi:CheY-like chemotaxis protein
MSDSRGGAEATAGSRGRILVVDDEEVLVRVIAKSLIATGYAVATAPDGMRGVDLLGGAPFDAIVSDIDMPNNERYSVLAERPTA